MLKGITRRETQETIIDAVNVVLGLGLALSPWVLGYTAESAAAWNAWIVGAAIALVAIGALVAFTQWEEWANLGLGLWAILAPWALGFAARPTQSMFMSASV